MKSSAKIFINLFSILLIVAISGCMVGPDFEKPEIATPENYRFANQSPQEVVNLEWWTLFNDPVLYDLVIKALNENKDIKIALSRIDEARAALGFVRADQFPRLDLEAGANRGNFSGGRIVDESNNSAFIAPVVNWEIDFWGKFRRATESARSDLIATEYGYRSIQISLISEIVSTYFLLLDFKERVIISRETLKSRTESLDIIQKRYKEGVIPEIDLNQAEIQKEIAAAAIPVNERLVAKAENALSILLGRFPEDIKTGNALYNQSVPPEIPLVLPATLLERRPDILEAQYLLQAQNAQIGVAQALRLPALNLTGSLGAATSEVSSMTTEGFAWSVGAGLFGPLFNFGKNESRVRIEEARTDAAFYNYENTVLLAFREVSDSLSDIETYREQLIALNRQTIAARNANRLSKLRYDQGFSSYLEVLETERALFSVELELSQATQEYYNSYVGLYKALGGGWIDEQEMYKPPLEETE